MRAEAYRSMADERGQLSHLKAAVSQVLVDRESRRRAGIRPAIAARLGRRGGHENILVRPAARACVRRAWRYTGVDRGARAHWGKQIPFLLVPRMISVG